MAKYRSDIEKKNAEFIEKKFEQAKGKKPWMVALFTFDGERVTLDRSTFNFPAADFTTAVRLLSEELMRDIHKCVQEDFNNALKGNQLGGDESAAF